jgi:hypothetical protein
LSRTGSGADVAGRPVAEHPPAKRRLLNELAEYDADTLDEVMVVPHALLADLTDVNGVDE